MNWHHKKHMWMVGSDFGGQMHEMWKTQQACGNYWNVPCLLMDGEPADTMEDMTCNALWTLGKCWCGVVNDLAALHSSQACVDDNKKMKMFDSKNWKSGTSREERIGVLKERRRDFKRLKNQYSSFMAQQEMWHLMEQKDEGCWKMMGDTLTVVFT